MADPRTVRWIVNCHCICSRDTLPTLDIALPPDARWLLVAWDEQTGGLKGRTGGVILARIVHEYLLRQPMLSPGWAFLVLPPRRTIDPLQIEEQRVPLHLRRPHLREGQAGFGLSRLATTFMNNPG